MKKRLIIIGLVLCSLFLTACSGLSHYDQLTPDKEYNKSLFYRNDLLTSNAADPSVIYITEGAQAGYFYMYATSDMMGAGGYYAWRSKDLNMWEIAGAAFIPHPDSWGLTNLWAPEVIYHSGQYWMYYSATNYRNNNRKGISVAVSDNPQGPFKEYTGKDYYGNDVDHTDQLIMLDFAAIDASPFADGDDLYLYFAKDQVGGVSTLYGVKMLDMVTPDLSTLKELTHVGKSYVGEVISTQGWELKTNGRWNEAPFMYKHNGKYYLTYSANPYYSKNYGVGVAVGSSPLGDFVKPVEGNPILAADPDWDHASGTGHHSFVKAGDELFAVYHAHLNRDYGEGRRAIAADRVFFDDDGAMFVHGPTYSIQPLPEVTSGYKNIMSGATITVKGRDDTYLLNDNRVAYRDSDDKYVFYFESETTITIEFEQERTMRAILVYNSYDYETAFKSIKKIDFKNAGTIKNLGFSDDYIGFEATDDGNYYWMRPGAAAVAEFNELKTNKVTLTIAAKSTTGVSEIVILGK